MRQTKRPLKKNGSGRIRVTTPKPLIVRMRNKPKPLRHSKAIGQTVLGGICPKLGIRTLPVQIFAPGQSIILGKFDLTGKDRILVRTDLRAQYKRDNSRLNTTVAWNFAPRKIFRLKDTQATEVRIRQWVEQALKSVQAEVDLALTATIIHPLRPKENYVYNGLISVREKSLGSPKGIFIKIGPAKGREFRQAKRFSEGKIDLEKGSVEAELPAKVKEKILSLIRTIKTNYSGKTFETSFVSYRGELNDPEFYDLLFT